MLSNQHQQYESVLCPGVILHQIAERYRDGHYDDGDLTREDHRLYVDLITYLRTHCFDEVDGKIFKLVQKCMPMFWEVFVPPSLTPYSQSNRLPVLQEAIDIAKRHAVDKEHVKKNKIFIESVLVAIRYILEVKRIGKHGIQIESIGLLTSDNYPIADFFTNYNQVRECYTKNPYYPEDLGLKFKRPRYPEKESDVGSREKCELMMFGNVMKVTLPLILNLNSKRKPVTEVIESLIGGISQERKLQSGSGMTDFSRRRYTIFEDEANVTPVPETEGRKNKIKIKKVIELLNSQEDIQESLEKLTFSAGLNHALNQNMTHHKIFDNDVEVLSRETSSRNGKSVISSIQVLQNGEVIAESAKMMYDLTHEIIDFDCDSDLDLFSPQSPSQDHAEHPSLSSSSSSSSSSAAGYAGGGSAFITGSMPPPNYNNSMTSNIISSSSSIGIPPREYSIRTLLTNDGTSLEDFEAFTYDFGGSLDFPDDGQVSELASENKDLRINSQVIKEGDNNITHRGISITRVKSSDAWNVIQRDSEVLEAVTGLVRQTSDQTGSLPGRNISRLVSLNKPISSHGWTRSLSSARANSGVSNVSFSRVFDSLNSKGSSDSHSPNSSRSDSSKRSERENDSDTNGSDNNKKSNAGRYSYDDLQNK